MDGVCTWNITGSVVTEEDKKTVFDYIEELEAKCRNLEDKIKFENRVNEGRFSSIEKHLKLRFNFAKKTHTKIKKAAKKRK